MKKTELVCVIDRSGSMHDCRADAEGGFNTFIENQQKLDLPCKVALHHFDDKYETIWPRQRLADVGQYTLDPRGSTALLDAIGQTIIGMDPKPNRNVIVVIVTDGQENASTTWSLAQVRKLIEEKQAAGWSFVFLGAGIDAFAEGGRMGISAGSTVSASATSAGYNSSYEVMDSAVETSRTTGQPVEFTDEDRERIE